MGLAEILNAMFSPIFGIFFHLTRDYHLNVMLGVALCAVLISAVMILITKKMVDQDKMREYKKKIKEYQKKMREAREKNDKKALEKVNIRMMEVQKEMMMMSMKPMLYTLLPIILIFNWLRYYEYLNNFIATHGYLVALPFALPHVGNTLGWFGWYIFCSIPTSSILKVILKMET